MHTVLLTGFEPFNGESINPSWEAVRALDGWRGANFVVHARQIPCVFGRAIEALAQAIGQVSPDLVIAVGQAGGRSELSIERVAINIDDAAIMDNAQRQPVDLPVVAGGPAAYFSSLPIKAIVHAIRDGGLPASVSQTAGTFVCNHLFYGLMHHAATRMAPGVKAGFIHIPYLPQQAAAHRGAPSMALGDLLKGLRIAIATSVATGADLREAGGSTH